MNITLEALIQEHKERIKILRYHREAFIPYYDYENMEAYIRVQSDGAEVMIEFKKQIQLSKVQNNPYRAVLAWFMQKYEDVNSYTEYFDKLAAEKKAREEAEKAAAATANAGA